MARTVQTLTTINPSGRYRPVDAARLMHISIRSLYNYTNSGRVKSKVAMHEGKPKHYIEGLEIIRFNENRFFEPV